MYCLDIEGSSRRRPSDDQIWLKIKDKTGVTNSTSFQQLDENKREEIFLELKDCGASLRQLEHPTDLQKKEKADRNEILIEAIQYGAPLRQLSRLTGVSYGVIQRINGKMKVGQ